MKLYKEIVDVQGEAVELVAENNALKAEVNTLKEKLKTQESLKFAHDVYWIESSEGPDEGPYCSTCWDTKEQLVHMIHGRDDTYRCHTCKLVRIVSR